MDDNKVKVVGLFIGVLWNELSVHHTPGYRLHRKRVWLTLLQPLLVISRTKRDIHVEHRSIDCQYLMNLCMVIICSSLSYARCRESGKSNEMVYFRGRVYWAWAVSVKQQQFVGWMCWRDLAVCLSCAEDDDIAQKRCSRATENQARSTTQPAGWSKTTHWKTWHQNACFQAYMFMKLNL